MDSIVNGYHGSGGRVDPDGCWGGDDNGGQAGAKARQVAVVEQGVGVVRWVLTFGGFGGVGAM